MSYLGIFLLFIYVLSQSEGRSLLNYIDKSDKDRFQTFIYDSYVKAQNDPKTASLAVVGHFVLERKFPKENEACEMFKKASNTKNSVDTYYQIVTGSEHLKDVKCDLNKDAMKGGLKKIEDSASVEELYKIIYVMKFLGDKVSTENVDKLLLKLKKKEHDVALSQAYGYMITVTLWKNDTVRLEKQFNEIKDTIQQADEADDIYLYYDNQLEGTAFILRSILELSNAVGRAPPVDRGQIIKFGNFLVSRRHTQKLSVAIGIVRALNALGRNKYCVPLSVQPINRGLLKPMEGAGATQLQLLIHTVWGDPVTRLTLTAKSAQNTATKRELLTKGGGSFKEGSLPGQYEMDLKMNGMRVSRGFYLVDVQIEAPEDDKRFEKVSKTSTLVKVTTEVAIENAELFVKEKEQLNVGAQSYKLKLGVKLTDILEVNIHRKLELTFKINDRLESGSEKDIRPHQVFLKMQHIVSKQEIIFVVEPEKSGSYKFVLDLEKNAKDFDYLSGEYEMTLIIGDALIQSPIDWDLGKVVLDIQSFSGKAPQDDAIKRSVAGSKKSPRVGGRPASGPKKEIYHMFRPAEKRGGRTISTVFTVLCTVLPFLLLFSLWISMRINVSNFKLSISALLFHLGLAGIFGLYWSYWKFLSMFTTLRYLLILGGVTAFFGNRVLRHIATTNKASSGGVSGQTGSTVSSSTKH